MSDSNNNYNNQTNDTLNNQNNIELLYNNNNNNNENFTVKNGQWENLDKLNNNFNSKESSSIKNGLLSANSKSFKPVNHVIFDLDGLLINSEICFANAIAILLRRYGVAEYPLWLQEKVLGMEVARGIEEIINQTGIPLTVEEFMKTEREIYQEELLKVKLMPGAKRLIQHLHQNNIPMAIATGSTNESFLIKTTNHQDIFAPGKYFQHIVFTRDDKEVKRPKPAPDVYLITAGRFPSKPSPQQCLVFEDSSIGVDGAIKAGMQCIMVPDVRFECKQKNATLILKSLEHFQPELFGLPAFPSD